MKKYTKRQRRLKYISAAKFTYNANTVLCYALTKELGMTLRMPTNYIKEIFPEFAMFEPSFFEYTSSVNRAIELWFGDYELKENNEARIICMLFCAEMCND